MTSDPAVPPEPPPVDAPSSPEKVPFTKTAAAWWALIVGVLILIVLLIFIAQNLDSTTIKFLGWQWIAPTGIAFLVAAICGSLITVLAGAARIIQLRRVAKKGLRVNRT
jgi:uncharacterized integral membrane protein